MQTPQQVKRENVRDVFRRVLGTRAVELSPISISAKESCNSDYTSVDFEYDEKILDDSSRHHFESVQAKGFIDGIHTSLLNKYSDKYRSLRNLQLSGLVINPNFSKKVNYLGSDAVAKVAVQMLVKDRGPAEFESTSRSLLYSSFAASLKAFQFYINCQRTFEHIGIVMADAKSRNRGDITERCLSDLHCLTTVNSYDKG
jgi:hypothetical protein